MLEEIAESIQCYREPIAGAAQPFGAVCLAIVAGGRGLQPAGDAVQGGKRRPEPLLAGMPHDELDIGCPEVPAPEVDEPAGQDVGQIRDAPPV